MHLCARVSALSAIKLERQNFVYLVWYNKQIFFSLSK